VSRKRRIELYIEHREIYVFAGAGPLPGQTRQGQTKQGKAIDQPESGGTGTLQVRPTACPTCGSPDLVLLTDAIAHAHLALATLNQGMQDGSVHFHRSPSGEWWICTKSL
jgi:hypothetical protein